MLGTKIYYSKITGNILYIRRDINGVGLRETTLEEDYKERSELNGYNIEVIGVLTYEYGEYYKLSKNSTGCYFDLDKQELVFTYEELSNSPIEPTLEEKVEEQGNKIKSLTEDLNISKQENANLYYELMINGLI